MRHSIVYDKNINEYSCQALIHWQWQRRQLNSPNVAHPKSRCPKMMTSFPSQDRWQLWIGLRSVARLVSRPCGFTMIRLPGGITFDEASYIPVPCIHRWIIHVSPSTGFNWIPVGSTGFVASPGNACDCCLFCVFQLGMKQPGRVCFAVLVVRANSLTKHDWLVGCLFGSSCLFARVNKPSTLSESNACIGPIMNDQFDNRDLDSCQQTLDCGGNKVNISIIECLDIHRFCPMFACMLVNIWKCCTQIYGTSTNCLAIGRRRRPFRFLFALWFCRIFWPTNLQFNDQNGWTINRC